MLPDDQVPKLRPCLESLTSQVRFLAQRLLKCLAFDLQIDPETFLRQHSGMLTGQGNGSAVRLLHYPPVEQNSAQKITRCGKHTDYGGLTLLFQVRI